MEIGTNKVVCKVLGERPVSDASQPRWTHAAAPAYIHAQAQPSANNAIGKLWGSFMIGEVAEEEVEVGKGCGVAGRGLCCTELLGSW